MRTRIIAATVAALALTGTLTVFAGTFAGNAAAAPNAPSWMVKLAVTANKRIPSSVAKLFRKEFKKPTSACAFMGGQTVYLCTDGSTRYALARPSSCKYVGFLVMNNTLIKRYPFGVC
jgi:hypothetical protein